MLGKTNKNRRYPGESNTHRPDQAKQRRIEAEERQLSYDKLSPQDKLSKLDIQFGVGNGAKKQREKLQKIITSGSTLDIKDTKSELTANVISEEIMAEIDSLNLESNSNNKKKLKAKDRRAQSQKN